VRLRWRAAAPDPACRKPRKGGTMPPISDGIDQTSDHGLTVTARAVDSEDRRAHVCLAGHIDMAACAVLSATIDWLTRLAPVSVLVDLANVTFACSTLPNFVARVRHAVPDGAEVILWRARPEIGRVLQITGMIAIATIRDEPARSCGLNSL
jgi:anti-anti-sigma factor